MKKTFAILLMVGITGVKSQVIIGNSVGTSADKTSVLLEFAAGQNKGIIVPYVTSLPTTAASGTILLDASSPAAARMKYYDGTVWKDLSGQDADVTSVLTAQPTGVSETNSKSIIGTSSSVADGVLVLESATKAMVLPIVADVQDIASPSPGMMVYVKKSGSKRLAVFNGNKWSFWESNSTSTVAVVTSLTGRIWMDRNLGASQVSTSPTDVLSYGDLYQWGRGTDGHEKRTSSTTSILSATDSPGHGQFILIDDAPRDWRSPQNDNLWLGANGSNNPCPSGFRLPTMTELIEERNTWISQNAAGAFASPLKLPLAGLRYFGDGLVVNQGDASYYWSSTSRDSQSQFLAIDRGARILLNIRSYGLSVRCIKD